MEKSDGFFFLLGQGHLKKSTKQELIATAPVFWSQTGSLLLFSVLATSKVISGRVQTCDSVVDGGFAPR